LHAIKFQFSLSKYIYFKNNIKETFLFNEIVILLNGLCFKIDNESIEIVLFLPKIHNDGFEVSYTFVFHSVHFQGNNNSYTSLL